jgi:HAMP domain-containing protein
MIEFLKEAGIAVVIVIIFVGILGLIMEIPSIIATRVLRQQYENSIKGKTSYRVNEDGKIERIVHYDD